MFCKYCGKNIYDLEKCPFCNDGEKLDASATNETCCGEAGVNEGKCENANEAFATEQKVVSPARKEGKSESVEVAQDNNGTNKQQNERTEASKGNAPQSFVNPFEPTKETVGFHRRLVKENKLYNAMETLGLIILIVGIVGVIAFILASFIKNGTTNLGALGTVVKGIYNYIPFAYLFFIIFGLTEIVQMIIYIVNAYKKATNKELFADVCNLENGAYIYGSTQVSSAWEAISLKYARKDFVCKIIMYVVRFAEVSIFSAFGALSLSIFLHNIDYGIGRAAMAALASIPGIVLLISEFIIESFVIRILEAIMKGQRKLLVAMLRRGELENVNQENKNEQ